MIKKIILSVLLVGLVSMILSAGAGLLTWSVAKPNYDKHWQTIAIPTPPEKAVEISYIHYYSVDDDPSGDIIYIATSDHRVFSYKLFNGRWSSVKAIARSEFEYEDIYSPGWVPPSDSPLWEKAPVKGDVQDATGTYFDHAVGGVMRCYILYPNGSIEVWTRVDIGSPIISRLSLVYLVGIGIYLSSVILGTLLAVGRLVREPDKIRQSSNGRVKRDE